MGRVDFVFALHNHQPVGNFEHVIEDAYQRAYAPLLAALETHPRVRACLHQSGVLWEWTEARHPEYLERVRTLIRRGQLELLSGAHYEPILSAIPEADRQGQIRTMNHWLEARFDVQPRGGWLAERVWEPQLAERLVRAGLQYTVVDDTHFISAGWPVEALTGSFVTEENGHLLRLFPIAKQLRYLLPFDAPAATLKHARDLAAGAADVLLVHADDGEKFGLWPGTHERCYGQGWLEAFFTALEANADWLRTTTFADALGLPPRGRIYLPTASYSEMMEWALPPAAQQGLRAARQRLEPGADGTDLRSFVRGGFWRNFLARYPEANWMHKRMLHVSRRLQREGGRAASLEPTQAELHLWRSQCNCAYWHGLFGGLYLPHLRGAVYQEILQAEAHLDGAAAAPTEVLDLDVAGRPEILLRSPQALAFVKPDSGGAVFELDDRRRCFNVLDLLARRPEAYHDSLREMVGVHEPAPHGTVSIHDLVQAKEPDLHRALVYDSYRRGSCIDHLLAASAQPAHFEAAALPELLPFWERAYDWRLEAGELRLECAAALPPASGTGRVVVVRRLRLAGPALEARYTVALDGTTQEPARFAVEMAANLRAGNAPDRWLEADGERLQPGHLASRGRLAAVQRLDLVDAWSGLRVVFECSPAMEVWRAPIETISTSESGFEKVYQGTALLFLSPAALQPGALCSFALVQRLDDA